jgi:hypothetical protein
VNGRVHDPSAWRSSIWSQLAQAGAVAELDSGWGREPMRTPRTRIGSDACELLTIRYQGGLHVGLHRTAAQEDPEAVEQAFAAASPTYADLKQKYDRSRKTVTRTGARWLGCAAPGCVGAPRACAHMRQSFSFAVSRRVCAGVLTVCRQIEENLAFHA